MEEILIFVLQFVFEVLIELVAYVGFNSAWSRYDRLGCLYFVALIGVAGGFAGLTNWIQPRLLLPNETLRVLNLIVTPLVIGIVVYGMLSSRKAKAEEGLPLMYSLALGLFVLVYGLVRYAWGVH